MKVKDIKRLYDETSDLLSELNELAVSNGYLLENDLETGLLSLLLDNDYNEITLVRSRIIGAMKKIKNGTFKLLTIKEELLQATA